MKRITSYVYTAAIEAAYRLIPVRIADLIRPDFLTGSDPVFVGLHDYGDASYGRSYRDTAHVAYPWHQYGLQKQNRVTTVVLPTLRDANIKTIVHELGHVLDEGLSFAHSVVPISWYAETNRQEAFAEGFTAWLLHGYAEKHVDEATLALFEGLAI